MSPEPSRRPPCSLDSKCCVFVTTSLEPSDWRQKTGSEQVKTEDEDEEDLTGNQEEDLVFRLQNVVYLKGQTK